MAITVQYSSEMLHDHSTLNAEMKYESFSHLRDVLKTYAFAPIYRMRSHANEFGRIISRELLAVMDDGREYYLGNVVLIGDRQ